MRIVIVASNASRRFGGEAFIPFNYFRLLLARGEDVHLVAHARNREELYEEFPDHLERLHFAKDTAFHRGMIWLSRFLPRRVADITCGLAIHLSTQFAQRRLIIDLMNRGRVDVVHEPIPVSPKTPSLMYGLGTAVVVGPLNGGMEYPEAFRREQDVLSRAALRLGRSLAGMVQFIFPGKLRANVVLVANQRTRLALPDGVSGTISKLVENGVDFSIWRRESQSEGTTGKFIFVGRLVDWKAVDIVIEALARISERSSLQLEIVGDGPMRKDWEALAEREGVGSQVMFSGWLSQEACAERMRASSALVLPSLFECGGAVVLEAMAMGLPVIATDWGGPVDYLDSSCGILVKPESREALIDGFAAAMRELALSAPLRNRLGEAGYERARAQFDWDRKINQILEVYRSAAGQAIKR
ncbi:glycosyltransferase family 4 protein [Bradyrhizobium sp. HKCCYLS3077]|uniref:glycosyltransferase family 4 protein n=1 Tax=unclassified Bradyrhizobium TaxID=2631580 RepID=UPI003EBB9952